MPYPKTIRSGVKADWNLNAIDADQALGRLPGRPASYGDIKWKRGIRVAQLDTGIRPHPCFGDILGDETWVRMSRKQNLIEDGALPIEPFDPPTSSRWSTRRLSDLGKKDSDGHGTRIGSVICGDAKAHLTSMTTRVGVAPGLPLEPYRVTDTILIVEKWVADNVGKAIRLAVDGGAPVISISLGFPIAIGSKLGAAVDYAYRHGCIIVAAGGQIIDRTTYPGKYSRVITAGGVRPGRKIWQHYSGMNALVDCWAPAADIVRAKSDPLNAKWTYDFVGGTGTSYATAHVAAAAALWLQFHGLNKLNNLYRPYQRIEAFRTCLRRSSGALREPSERYPIGEDGLRAGLLRMWELLQEPLPNPSNPIDRRWLKSRPLARTQYL